MEKEQGDLRTPSRRHVCRIDAKHSAAAPCKRGRGGLQIRTKNTYSANTFAFGGFNTNCKLSRYMPLKIARLRLPSVPRPGSPLRCRQHRAAR